MVNKALLKQILLDNRREIENYDIVHRDIATDGFGCYVFVGVRRAGKSFILFEKYSNYCTKATVGMICYI